MADESKKEETATGLCITNRRSINTREGSVLTLMYIGMRHENEMNNKAINVLIPTPAAMFEEETNDYTTKPFDRVLIKPNSWNGNSTPFMVFLNRLEEVLMKCKTLGDRNGFMDVKWFSSVKVEDGVLNGVVCKVKKRHVQELLQQNLGKPLRFMIAINCLWYNSGKGGVSLEVTDVSTLNEETKTEDVQDVQTEA